MENEDLKITLSSRMHFQKVPIPIIKINIENKSNSAIKVIWDETVLTDNNNSESGVIHEGVKYINKNESQVPSIILPSKTFEDSIIPKTHIRYNESGYYEGWQIDPYDERIGERTLYLTYEINGERKSIMHNFELYYEDNNENLEEKTVEETDSEETEEASEDSPKLDKETSVTEEKSKTLENEPEVVPAEKTKEEKESVKEVPLDIQASFNEETMVNIRTNGDILSISFENIASQPIVIEWEYNYFKNNADEIVSVFPIKTKIISPNEKAENEIKYSNDFEVFCFEYKIGLSRKIGELKLKQDRQTGSTDVQSEENDPIEKTIYEEEPPQQNWFEENKTLVIIGGVGIAATVALGIGIAISNSQSGGY